MKNATRLAVCGIATALSVLLLFFGGIVFILVYTMPMLAGLFMIMLHRTFGAASAWITYAATSVLSFILVADKECMLMYIMFFGFYPIIQSGLSRMKITPLRIMVKLLIFNCLLAAAQLILIYVFGIPILDEGESKRLIVCFFILMNFIFVFYDRILIRFSRLYSHRLESKIKKYFK